MSAAVDPVLVRTENLSRAYRRGDEEVCAVHSLTIEYFARTQAALMGSSGSGKSTLLHLFAGLEQPSGGTIAWPALGGADDLRPAKIAVAFQTPSLVPFLSVVENVALPLVAFESGKAVRAAAVEALARMNLDDLADKLPEELSGGQAQRFALARATVSRPRLLLADEPTGQLDHATAAATIASLVAYAEEHDAALLVATHDAAIAERFREIWDMDRGWLRPRKAST
jgi:ABC-type lipoprotein export system ATPase subunit